MAYQKKNNLRPASQAEILRAHQRDNDFISQMSESMTDLLHRYNLQRRFFCYFKSEIPAKLLYFVVTSGLGNQTLGEEYTGIVQANLNNRTIPTLMTRILAAILECFGEQMLLKLLDKLQYKINKNDSELTPQAKFFLNIVLNRTRTIVPILILVHRGLFYLYGRYYNIGRRFAGIDYVKVYGPRPHSSVSWGLRILGCVTIAQCLFHLWQSKNYVDNVVIQEKELDGSISKNCQLCLEKVPNATTPCGHLFCWNCLSEWVRARNRCPLCRESVTSSRIIPLMNM